MPIAKMCPTCGHRMKRLYERERTMSRSKYWGYLWLCPDKHTAIVDHRESETLETYELKEMLTDAST
ncbi:MAG: hypothetical protein ACTSWU_02790 [Candidatus Thorarchaeota archaeon]